ncbi:MAG: hypothetical protein LBG91_05735 [Treponema sp.]|jgi:hypothetical protein|nr:hypothetical protein [Treponema sp.]
MKNTIRILGITVLMAVICLCLFTSCDTTDDPEKQTVITITGIPSTYHEKYAEVILASYSGGALAKPKAVGIGLARKINSSGSVDLEMISHKNFKMLSVEGTYHVILSFYENSTAKKEDQIGDSLVALSRPISKGPTTVSYGSFQGADDFEYDEED